MHDFAAITPLGGAEPRSDTINGTHVFEVTDRALASVAARLGQEDQAQALVKELIDEDAPAPGRFSGSSIEAFWMGPDQWMIQAPFSTHEEIAAEIAAKSNGSVSVTEQTDGWCCFDVEGGDLVSIFEILCPVDLRNGKVGDCTRTNIDHLGCFVLKRRDDLVSVFGPRSSAASLHHALLTAVAAAS